MAWLKRVKGARTETVVLPVLEKEKGKTVVKGHGQGLITTIDDAFEVTDDVAEHLLADPAERFQRPAPKQITAAKKAIEDED